MKDERDPILEEHLAAWRSEERVDPPPDLALRTWTRSVMERHQQEAKGGAAAFFRRVLRPHVLRFRVTPAMGLALASMAIVGLWAGHAWGARAAAESGAAMETAASDYSAARPRTSTVDGATGTVGSLQTPGERPLPAEVPIRFVLRAEGAHSVAVAGDFNDWRVGATNLDDAAGDGVFVSTVWLQPGTYSYMFVVDGKRWVTDPFASNHRNDGFGHQNAVLRID